MGKWLELAARMEASDDGDNRDIRDNSSPFGPIVPFVPNVPHSLPVAVREGLIRLKAMAAPRLRRPKAWPAVVSDALTLARDGWAAKALALGWDPLDVFGAVTDRCGPANPDGLAVWLAGRTMLAICETHASVADGAGRAYFNRCNRLANTLLWDIDR